MEQGVDDIGGADPRVGWLVRLADPAGVAEAAGALLEISVGEIKEAGGGRGAEESRGEEDARELNAYAPALAALGSRLDALIPRWVTLLLEQLRARHAYQQRVSAAVRSDCSSGLPPINVGSIVAAGQLTKVLRATGERLDPYVGPLLAAFGSMGRDGDESLAGVLDRVGPAAAAAAAPKLLAALREHGAWHWPSHAARAVANASRFEGEMVEALREMLSSDEARVREAAVNALGTIGPPARAAGEQLLAFCRGDERERCAAISALARLGEPSPAFLSVLEAAMRDENGYVRCAASGALGALTPDATRFVPLLIAACDWEEPLHDVSLPEVAVEVLGRYGPQAWAALPRLRLFIEGPIKGRTVPPDVVREAVGRIAGGEAIEVGEAAPATPAAAVPARTDAAEDDEPLFPVRHQGKQCYIDRRGRFVLQTRFAWGKPFGDGRAVVGDGRRDTFVIDRRGREVFRSEWDDVRPFSEGLAAVKRDGKWGFVDIEGRVVIQPRHDGVTGFSEGLAGFEFGRRQERDDDLTLTAFGRRGFLDRTGRVAIPAEWAEAAPFHGGLAAVCTGGTMRPSGIAPGHQVLLDGKYGYIDRTGRLVIPGRYPSVGSFCEGLAVVYGEERGCVSRCGYIDPAGREVIEPTLTSATSFKDGIAIIQRRGRRWREAHLVINCSGQVILELRHRLLGHFSEGLGVAWSGDAWGFLDLRGRWAIEPQFDDCEPLRNGLAEVQRGEWYGLIDHSGKFVWGPTTEGGVYRVLESEWTL